MRTSLDALRDYAAGDKEYPTIPRSLVRDWLSIITHKNQGDMILTITTRETSPDGLATITNTYEGTDDCVAGRRVYRKPNDDSPYVLVRERMMPVDEYLDVMENKHG